MSDDSPAFLAFARSLLGGVTSRAELEDLDLASLAALVGTEREAAELLLIEALAEGGGDPRVPRAMAQLGTPTALRALADALVRTPAGPTRWAIEEALRGRR